jgi:hypothetical protein
VGAAIPAVVPRETGGSRTVRFAELGIVDEKGNRIRADLPDDMKEGADRNFGG